MFRKFQFISVMYFSEYSDRYLRDISFTNHSTSNELLEGKCIALSEACRNVNWILHNLIYYNSIIYNL